MHSNRPDPQSPPTGSCSGSFEGRGSPQAGGQGEGNVLDPGARTEAAGSDAEPASLSPSLPPSLLSCSQGHLGDCTQPGYPPFCSGRHTARPALPGLGWGLPGGPNPAPLPTG